MNTVWITRETEYDLSGLAEFGRGSIIFPRDLSPLNIARQQEIVRTEVFPAASPRDFILTVGPSMMMCILVSMWMHRFGSVRLLAWNRHTCKYLEKYAQL